MGLKSMNKNQNMFILFRNILTIINIASFIYFFKYFETFTLVFKCVLSLYQKSAFPKLILSLWFFTNNLGVLLMSFRRVIIFPKSPIMVFNSMAKNVSFKSFLKLIFILAFELLSNYWRMASNYAVNLIPYLIN